MTEFCTVQTFPRCGEVYNQRITLSGIPEAAWEYVVNGKAALEWVMERQGVKTDKASGIINDANNWAQETMHNPKYPLELFQRVITVSLKTQEIIAEYLTGALTWQEPQPMEITA